MGLDRDDEGFGLDLDKDWEITEMRPAMCVKKNIRQADRSRTSNMYGENQTDRQTGPGPAICVGKTRQIPVEDKPLL